MKAAWIASALMVAYGVWGQSSQPPSPARGIATNKQQEQPAKSESVPKDNENGSGPPAVTVNVIPSQSTDVQPQAQSASEDHHSSADWWIAGATVALAITTLSLALYTAKLWRTTKTLVDETKGTAKQQLRAYVSAEPLEFRIITPDPPGVKTILKNHGSTPAHHLFHNCEIAVISNPLPQNFDFPYSIESVGKFPFTLFPGQTREYQQNRAAAFSADEINKLKSGNGYRLYVYGIVFYRDAFEEKHQTTYCIYMESVEVLRLRDEFARSGIADVTRWNFAERYNEAT